MKGEDSSKYKTDGATANGKERYLNITNIIVRRH